MFRTMKATHLLLALMPGLCASAFGIGVTECTDGALREAASIGGNVTFECDGTIHLTNTINIVKDTILHGGARSVVISGGRRVRLFNVASGNSLKLVNLVLADGAAIGAKGERAADPPAMVIAPENAEGGAIAGTNATIVIDSCVFTNNVAKGGDLFLDPLFGISPRISYSTGGAISLHGGGLAITKSLFAQNSAEVPYGESPRRDYYGNGLAVGGAVTVVGCDISITNSVFVENKAGTPGGGAIFAADSRSYFVDSVFERNTALGNISHRFAVTPPGAGRGGALLLTNSPAEVRNCSFISNSAAGGTTYSSEIEVGQGGAIYSNRELRIEHSSFVANRTEGDASGGALFSADRTTISNTRFVGNASIGATVTANGAGFAGPGNGLGGAIASYGALSIDQASFISNSVEAGLVYLGATVGSPRVAHGGALYATGPVQAINITVALNEASGLETTNAAGSAFYLDARTNTVSYSTFASNRIVTGTEKLNRLFEQAISTGPDGDVTVHATILSGGTSNLLLGRFIDLGYNLSSDQTFSHQTSRSSIDPLLSAPALNRGHVETMRLAKGSPAVDTGDPTQFPPIDARGESRPFGSAPDIGAFEYRPGDSPAVLGIVINTIGVVKLTSFDDAGRTAILERTTAFDQWLPVATNAPGIEGAFDIQPTANVELFRLRLE
jgi:predicted outer membrane repeat protein